MEKRDRTAGLRKGSFARSHASPRWLEIVCDNATVALFIMDEHQHCVYMNPAAEELTGFALEEVQNEPLHNFVHHTRPDGSPYPLAECPIDRAFPTQNRQAGEETFVHKDGHFYQVAYTASPIRDGENVLGTIIEVRDVTQERAAQTALRANEELLRAVVEGTPESVKLVAQDGRLLHINRAGLAMIEAETEASVCGSLVSAVIAPEHRRQWEENHQQVCAGNRLSWEFEIIGLRGTRRWMETHAVPLGMSDGTTAQLAITRDVSDKKRTAQEREELLRAERAARAEAVSILESMSESFFSITSDWRVTYMNAAAQETLSLRAEEVVGRNLWEAFPGLAGTRFEQTYRRCMETRQSQSLEDYFAPFKNWYEVNVYPGNKGGITLFFRQITERKQAETLLRRQKEILEAIAQGLPLNEVLEQLCQLVEEQADEEMMTSILLLDDDGQHLRPVAGNRVPASWSQFITPFLIGPHAGSCGTAAFRAEPVIVSDITQSPFWAPYAKEAQRHGLHACWSSPILSRDRKVLGTFANYYQSPHEPTTQETQLVDLVTRTAAVAIERHRAEQVREELLASERAARSEAERASRMKDEFLATLSHELRTPLNAILGWAQLLSVGRVSPEDHRHGLGTIERNARLQAKIIEDLLDMSRIVSGKIRLDVQRIELMPVIEAALETVRPAAEAKGIRLQPVLDPSAGIVSGDPARLQQVFWNLLSNAIKFTEKGGRVQILLERVNSHLEVSIIDTGAGIAPEFLPHVFDRFRQADASSTRQHGGLGLGLAIVKQLVEMHGGTVRAKSPGPGQGSTFIVELPLMVLHPDHETRPLSEPTSVYGSEPCPKLDGIRVLVVDDEPDARELLLRVLQDCEAEVALAGSVAEAIEEFESFRPHVVVSDIGMPNEDGYSLIRKIRKLPELNGKDTPAIALTAYARSEDRRRAILSGFQMHLVKPVEPMELIAMVASLVGRTGL